VDRVFLFRKIDDEKSLRHYHSFMEFEYIVQAMVLYPMEVSVFYIRHPKASMGTVTGFLHKIPLQVLGDGENTLAALVAAHPKAKERVDELYLKHIDNWNKIIPAGEKYMLSYAANHNRGAHFVDLKEHIDDQLVKVFDRISLDINDFFMAAMISCAIISKTLKTEKISASSNSMAAVLNPIIFMIRAIPCWVPTKKF
jgi:hypothetical protein